MRSVGVGAVFVQPAAARESRHSRHFFAVFKESILNDSARIFFGFFAMNFFIAA